MFNYIDKPKLPAQLIEHIYKLVDEYKTEAVLPEFDKMHINESILNEIEKSYPKQIDGLGVSYDTIYKNETNLNYEGLATFTMVKADDIISNYISDNICKEYRGLHIIIMEGTHVFPHIDLLRNSAWNYVVSSGNASTCFYSPKEEYKHLPIFPRSYIPFERVDKIKSIEIEEHRWHKLDVSSIHGVENINRTRIILSISSPTE